jgi:membrane protein implicated in regulation of membrane protease activity
MLDSYQIYLYLGIAFVILHILLYGLSLHLSYFGLILIMIGYFRPALSSSTKNFLWFFIVLDIIANILKIYEVYTLSSSTKKISKKGSKPLDIDR